MTNATGTMQTVKSCHALRASKQLIVPTQVRALLRKSSLGLRPDSEIDTWLQVVDVDADGSLDFVEFLRVCQAQHSARQF